MQSARGIYDERIRLAVAGGVDRVVNDARGVRSLFLRDQGRAASLRPEAELLDRRRAEGVRRDERDVSALLP